MKKLFLLFAAMLMTSAMAIADAPRVTLNFKGPDNFNIGTTKLKVDSTFSFGGDTITMIADSKNGYNYFINTNSKPNDTVLFMGKSGAGIQFQKYDFAISKIMVYGGVGASASTNLNIFAGSEAASTAHIGSTGTITFLIDSKYQVAGTVLTLKVSSGHNAQIQKIEIYEAIAGAPANPQFSVAAGTYTSAQSVELTCDTADAAIYYTLDGTEPTSASTLYTAAINVTEPTTIKAIAIKNDKPSAVVSAYYNVVSTAGDGTQENPFTVADVIKLNNIGTQAWVIGKIAGCYVNNKITTKADEFTATNLALAAGTDTIPVELPSGEIRDALSLLAHPDYVGAEIKLHGNLVAYFSKTGVKGVSEYIFTPASARIGAYDLRMVENEGAYTFSFKANIDARSAKLVLMDNEGAVAHEKAISVVAGDNQFTFSAEELELEAGEELNWGVELHAAPIKDFTKVYEEVPATKLQRKFMDMDRNPESPHFGRIYSEDRITGSNCHVTAYNADYSVLVENVTSVGNVGRPSVDEQGFVYCSDYGDGSAGIQVIDPANLTTSTQLFQGAKTSDGLYTTADGQGICGSTMCAEIYGSGKNTQLIVSNEDPGTGLIQASGVIGCLVFNLGQEDGSIARTWDAVPSHQVPMLHNVGSTFSIRKTDKGMWWAENRGKNQNLSANRSLQFYNNADSLVFESTDTQLFNGSNGGGMDVSRDGSKLVIVNGDGNLLVFSVVWDGETPTLTHDTTFVTGVSAVGSISMDYAGNLVCAAGTYGSNMRIIVWAMPTEDNSVMVPAQKSQIIVGPEAPFEPEVGDNILWTINDVNASYGDITAANNKYRDLAYYNDQVIVLTNPLVEGFNRILKLNANTGAYEGNVSVEGIWGGDIPLSSIQILDNGEMVAMCCRVNPVTGKVKFYGWDNLDAAPTLLGQVNLANGGKRVEALYYQGTLANGKFYCAAESSNIVSVIPVVNKATVEDQISYITLTTYTMESAPRVAEVTDSSLYVCCKGKLYGWVRSDSVTTATDGKKYAELTVASQEATSGVKLFEYKGENYWATLNFANNSATSLADPQIFVATYTSIGRWAAAGKTQKFLSDETLLASATRNTSFQSGIAVRVNENGYNVWMCSNGQGIIAYQFVDEPEDPTIVEEIEAMGEEVRKVMINGHIFIIREGHMYNMNGMLVK